VYDIRYPHVPLTPGNFAFFSDTASSVFNNLQMFAIYSTKILLPFFQKSSFFQIFANIIVLCRFVFSSIKFSHTLLTDYIKFGMNASSSMQFIAIAEKFKTRSQWQRKH